MRAEASAEIFSDPSAANADINILRSRVEMNEIDYSAMSIVEFREEILRERAVELYMEGHRCFDLTRFGVYEEQCRFVYGDTDGARQAEDYTWPIPIIETSTNSEIDQLYAKKDFIFDISSFFPVHTFTNKHYSP